MFTGIIEAVGEIVKIDREGTNIHFLIRSKVAGELKVDQSISHDGVCLTVTRVRNDTYGVTLIDETLNKSNFRNAKEGDLINLERSMASSGRFDGHIVQGHVDQVAVCRHVEDQDGSYLYTFEYSPAKGSVLVEKGSICVNGISLTCFDCIDNRFSVAIIPYTYENTNIRNVKPGSLVNLEFDVIGKYVAKLLEDYNQE